MVMEVINKVKVMMEQLECLLPYLEAMGINVCDVKFTKGIEINLRIKELLTEMGYDVKP